MVDFYWIIIIGVVCVCVLDEEKKDARAKKIRRIKSILYVSIKSFCMIGVNGVYLLYIVVVLSVVFIVVVCFFVIL